jgi:hypothetical protein
MAARGGAESRIELTQQHGHGVAAGPFHGGGDGGQGRAAKVGAKDIVATNNAHVLRHADTALTQPLQHPDGHQVIEGYAGGGTGVDQRVRRRSA